MINNEGKEIIGIEHKCDYFKPLYLDNKYCFVGWVKGDGSLFAIFDNHGTELFRFNRLNLYFSAYNQGYDIVGPYNSASTYMVYNDINGFGIFENPQKYEEKYGSYSEEYQKSKEQPQILWTGIKLPDNCSLSNFEPSHNNKKAPIIDLEEAARRYRNGASASNYSSPTYDYSMGYYIPNQPIQPTPQPSPSNDATTPKKHFHNVTRQVTCPMCLGLGKCSTCNGKGWYNNHYTSGTVRCPNCRNGNCTKCNGNGTITKTETVYD